MEKVPNYHFHSYGAGGRDGEVELFEYSWEQVTNIRIPVTVSKNCTKVIFC